MRALFESIDASTLIGMTLFELVAAALVSASVGYYLSRLLGIRETQEIWEYAQWGARALFRKVGRFK
jgi:hypothetical protein